MYAREIPLTSPPGKGEHNLPQPQLIIPARCDFITPRAVGRGAAAVAGDDARLLALDVGVDAGHPGVDLVGKQSSPERLDVIGPALSTLSRRLEPRQLPFLREPHQPGDPVDAVFDRARN